MASNVIITGASDGIGLKLAALYAAETGNLIGVGRRSQEKLPNWPNNANYFQGDQASPDFADNLLNHINSLGWNHVDNLIINAAIGKTGDPVDETAENIQLTLDTNLIGPITLAQKFYPLLAAGPNRSCLTLIGSVAHKGAANFASYAASKAGLAGFARALHEEWKHEIDVQIFHPGATATNMHKKAGLELGKSRKYFINPQYSARKIKAEISTGRPVATIGHKAWALDRVKNIFGAGV
ncbi:MAG: SDR family NAD(P)-dependent oxidoreductase [Rhizobiaceae bacterium]